MVRGAVDAVLKYLLIGLGGGLGANARYVLQTVIADRWGVSFPYGTFVINVSGSFAIGLLLTLLSERLQLDPNVRLFGAVGFLGGYTTFSSYTYEGLTLIQQGAIGEGSLYLLGSVLLGMAAVTAGVLVGRLF